MHSRAGLSLCSGDTDDMIDLLSPSDNPQRERTPFCLDNTSCFHFKDSDQHSIASNSFGSTVHNLCMVLVLELQIEQALWRYMHHESTSVGNPCIIYSMSSK